MDALVGKALEKDRDKRYQNMAEFLEAVSTCRGLDTISGQRPAAGFTREMGGAHAKAALGKPAERASDAELVPRGWEEAAASEFGDRPARALPNQKLILAAVGVALGVAGALWFALSRGSAPGPPAPAAVEEEVTSPPAPAQPPAPVAAPIPPRQQHHRSLRERSVDGSIRWTFCCSDSRAAGSRPRGHGVRQARTPVGAPQAWPRTPIGVGGKSRRGPRSSSGSGVTRFRRRPS